MPQLPSMPASVMAAMKEDLAAYRTDYGSGETDMDFQTWLRTQRPERYRVFMQGMGNGKQDMPHGGIALQ